MFESMRGSSPPSHVFHLLILCTCIAAGPSRPFVQAQASTEHGFSPEPEAELQTAIALTRRGLFEDAIPHFLAVQGRVAEEYVATFNLALCYVGTGRFDRAVPLLIALRDRQRETAEVNNLLAQAYLGEQQPQLALVAFKRAVALAPKNEKLYLFAADAYMDHQYYAAGLNAVELGLLYLPDSPRLHYHRAVFLCLLDEFDLAKTDFDAVGKLAPESDISYLATAQKHLFAGAIPEAIRTAREAIKKDHADFILLAILGESLIRSGAAPGDKEFAEAQAVLEKSVAAHPNYPSSQIALGKLYLMNNRLDEAILHLEFGRRLEPLNPSAYSNLAAAYRRRGDLEQAQNIVTALDKLNQQQAARIRDGSGEREGHNKQ